ncbi:hypothetical protein ACROYT_G041495 [Oculina patagonica]
MKKGSLVLLIALSALLVVFSGQVTGVWAGVPPGKRESSFGDENSKRAAPMMDYCHRCSNICGNSNTRGSTSQEVMKKRRR